MQVLKNSYTLTLGELDFEDLNTTKFLIFVVFTTFIALFLMNLLIAILSDAYELVTSEKKYYNGKAQLHRSLSYERLAQFVLRLLMKKQDQTYHHLFVSLPVSFLDDANNEDEGMVGKILHASRMSHKEIKAEIKARFDEN